MLSSPREFRRGLPVWPTTAVRQPTHGQGGVAGRAPSLVPPPAPDGPHVLVRPLLGYSCTVWGERGGLRDGLVASTTTSLFQETPNNITSEAVPPKIFRGGWHQQQQQHLIQTIYGR